MVIISNGERETSVHSDQVECSCQLGQRLSPPQLQHLQGIAGADLQSLHPAERPQHYLSCGEGTMRPFLPQALPGQMVQQPEEPKLPALLRHLEPHLT